MNTRNTRVPPDEKTAPALCLGFQYTLAVESARQVRVNQRQIILNDIYNFNMLFISELPVISPSP